MPARTARSRLRDLFRHGGIDLPESRAEAHLSALARMEHLDRQLSNLHMGATPIPARGPWPRDVSGRTE